MSESHGRYPVYKEVKSRDSTNWFRIRIWRFQTQFESGIFKCIAWVNGSFFEGDHQGSERGSRDLFNGTKVSSQLAELFYVFTVHICSLWEGDWPRQPQRVLRARLRKRASNRTSPRRPRPSWRLPRTDNRSRFSPPKAEPRRRSRRGRPSAAASVVACTYSATQTDISRASTRRLCRLRRDTRRETPSNRPCSLKAEDIWRSWKTIEEGGKYLKKAEILYRKHWYSEKMCSMKKKSMYYISQRLQTQTYFPLVTYLQH